MKCKKCKREIEDNSIYCNWCGHKQLTASNEVRVPVPRKKGNKWVAQVTVDGERVYVDGDSEEEYYAKAMAVKSRQLAIKKPPLGSHLERLLITILRITMLCFPHPQLTHTNRTERHALRHLWMRMSAQ